MATGDLNYGYGAFAAGETVNLFAQDVTPGSALISLAKTATAAASGGAAFTGVATTMAQHGATVPVYAVAIGATSGRSIGGVPDK